MRVCVIGGTGTIGSAVADALSDRHEVVRVGNSRGQHQVDLGAKESIEALYGEMDPAAAYVASIEGDRNGDVLDARDFA